MSSSASSTPGPSTPNGTSVSSYKSTFSAPPAVKTPYKPEDALDDISGVSYALELFLASHMVESEDYCHRSDPAKERLYFATGYGLIQCVKAMMSYENDDILAGLGHTKHGNHIAQLHRKKAPAFTSRLAGYVLTSLNTTGVGWIRSMTSMERHAELVYAESLFEKALLGIVYSGDWLAFIREALNMRTLINIYRELYRFLQASDAASPNEHDHTIDGHFRSGVYLGMGMSTLILSLIPHKILHIVELFGYKGDRHEALTLLMKAGGWGTSPAKEGEQPPPVPAAEEGLRRSICDMALLIFHLVLSSWTFDGVDISVAQRIIDWNLKRYPDGVFFLFGAGRLSLCRSQPEKAIEYYNRAVDVQSQYRNLHHISFWEIAVARLALWDLDGSLLCWRDLEKEATWSKSIYSYGMAVCLLESSQSTVENKEEAAKLMAKVPTLRQRIAGKSIPLEKFVARKARKFESQFRRLALPALELAYLFGGIAHAPLDVIRTKMLPEIVSLLSKLEEHRNEVGEKDAGGKLDKAWIGFWDDWCLAMFLKGVCLRYLAYPDPDALQTADLETKDEQANSAAEAFRSVFEHGPKIELDHHLVYHAHFELGRLLACVGKDDEAGKEFDLVLSGKYLEVGPSGRKGRYSLENALILKTSAAKETLGDQRRRL